MRKYMCRVGLAEKNEGQGIRESDSRKGFVKRKLHRPFSSAPESQGTRRTPNP